MPAHEPTTGPPSRRTTGHRLGLTFSQLAGSALAAASAAFGASYLGVGGTIIGAAVASVIATVATAMYTSSLQRTHAAVQSTVTQWTRTAATAPVLDPNLPRPGPAATVVPDPDAPEPDATEPDATDPLSQVGPDDTRELAIAPEPGRASYRRLPWTRLAVAAAAVLAVTRGTVTGVESILGKPLASVLGGSDATGTSLGAVGGSGSSSTKHHETKSSTASTGSTPTSTPTTTATPAATPTADPTTTPTDGTTGTSTPTPSPTAVPTATPTAN